MRQIRRLLPVLALVAAPLLFASPAGAASSLSVTPNTNLIEGQTLSVSGSGFPALTEIGVCQGIQTATPSTADCGDFGTFVTTDGSGSFTVTKVVHRTISLVLGGRIIDCASSPTACVMAAAKVSDIPGTIAFAPLQFKPAPPVATPRTNTLPEGNSGVHDAAVPVTLSVATNQTVTVQWTTVVVGAANEADPATDYTPASGTLTFAPLETTKTVPINVNGDNLDEPDEFIVVLFGNPTNATMGGFYGLGFAGITNDDHAKVVPGAASIAEGNAGSANASVPVTLSNPSTRTVTVQYLTVVIGAANEADPGNDYTPSSGSVTFAPGETAQTVPISVVGDTLVEPDELIVLLFGNPTNATMGGFYGLGFVGITNDD